jgi:hypothetical protein
MNTYNESILTQEEIDFILSLTVFELTDVNGESIIDSYDGESDNPFATHEYVEQGDADFDRETSYRLMDEYRKLMAEKELLDNPFE